MKSLRFSEGSTDIIALAIVLVSIIVMVAFS
jgi:hypothetical protein